MRGLSPVAASGGHSSSWCVGLSLSRLLLLRSTGSRRAGSVVVAHGLSCSAACGIFPDQGSNPCPLHWQADSQPLRHQGSPPSVCVFMWTSLFSSYLGVELLDYTVILSLTFWGTAKLNSKVAVPFYNLTSNLLGFRFLLILVIVCHFYQYSSHPVACEVVSHCGFGFYFPKV